jgi:protein-tyrosine phosphatase
VGESSLLPETMALAQRVLDEAGFVGVAGVEAKRHAETNERWFLEVNVRLPAQWGLGDAGGADASARLVAAASRRPGVAWRAAAGACRRAAVTQASLTQRARRPSTAERPVDTGAPSLPLTLVEMIDLHCHVLPGIDDGPETMEESVALARTAASLGTRVIVATPHVSRRYPNDVETILRLTDELNARLAREGVDLAVKPGAEIAITRIADIPPSDLSRLGLGGGQWLLVEPPFLPIATGVDRMVLDLLRRGQRIVLAHPERCPAFQREPPILGALVRAGALTSITAGSLVGRFGERVQRFALTLVREGLAHNVASDAHDCARRPPSVVAELQQAGLAPLTDWLASEVPRAIISSSEIPSRPAFVLSGIGPRPRFWHRRRTRAGL